MVFEVSGYAGMNNKVVPTCHVVSWNGINYNVDMITTLTHVWTSEFTKDMSPSYFDSCHCNIGVLYKKWDETDYSATIQL